MITVHHLNNSRSQRILWLLEELGLPYTIQKHQRDATTNLAPPELAIVHPLGKSPVVADHGDALIESGAIIEILMRRHGSGALQPVSEEDRDRVTIWLHYAEGSAMLPLMLKLYTSRLGDAAAPLAPRIASEIETHLGFVEKALEGRDWLVGDRLSAADIHMSFVGEIAGAFGLRAAYPSMEAWVKRFQARKAYARALEKGGPYSFA